MGIDKGFDLVPALNTSGEDQTKWNAFLDHVRREFKDDPVMEEDAKLRALVFNQGEAPSLTYQAHRFRRFSSKVSGSNAGSVEEYIDGVTSIAIAHFGKQRIQTWNERHDELGYYDWQEVYDARKAE